MINERHDLAALLTQKDAEIEKLTKAIRWALGEEGEFGTEPEPLAGKYRRRFWWRSELRQRAGLDSMTGRADGSLPTAPVATGAESTAALTNLASLTSQVGSIVQEMRSSGDMNTTHWMVTPATIQKWADQLESLCRT